MGQLLDDEGWEQVRSKRDKGAVRSGPDSKLKMGGGSVSAGGGSANNKQGGQIKSQYGNKGKAAYSNEKGKSGPKPKAASYGNRSKIQFTISENAKKFSYSDAVKAGAVGDISNLDLEFIQPLIEDGKLVGRLSNEAISEAEGDWDMCILLYVQNF